MHMSLLLMEQILELFLMILMGFIIVKAGIVTDEDSKVLSKIVLYLIIPCVIINAFQVNYTPDCLYRIRDASDTSSHYSLLHGETFLLK